MSKVYIPTHTRKLYAPITYWNAVETKSKELADTCNGCGAKEGIDVPDTFWGLSVTEACNIHDWMYKYGETEADKLFADAMFRMNISIIIDTNSNFVMSMLRHGRASKYYTAVTKWGDSAYWVGKTKTDSMNITFKGEFR